MKALLQVERGDLEEASNCVEQSLALDPHNVEALNTAGVLGLLDENGDKKQALSRLAEGSQAYEKGQEAVLYNHAIALGMMDETAMARRILRTFSKLELGGDLRRTSTQARLILQKQNALNTMGAD